jgi:DNA-binding GntR family transcriptional regulator
VAKASKQKTKMDLIVEMLREAVLTGELESGTRLLQDDLAQRFNTSSTPIREALRQLQAEGILEHNPYKGVQVAELKLEDMREIYMIRAVMESFVTRLAVPFLNSPHIDHLRQIQVQLQEQIQNGSVDKLRKLNYEFHFVIYEAAHMPYALKIIKNLWTQFSWDTLFVLPGRGARSLEEHNRIIEAIEQQDVKLAGQRVQEHIEYAAAALADYIDRKRFSGE